MREELVLRVAAKVLVPFIVAFALYVHFHGDYSPGGGFQAGVILTAAFVLLTLVFGLKTVQQVLPARFAQACAALGLLVYGGTGVATLFLGANYLGYNVLRYDPEKGQHLGIILVEAGVIITVFGVMATVFYLFAGRASSASDGSGDASGGAADAPTAESAAGGGQPS